MFILLAAEAGSAAPISLQDIFANAQSYLLTHGPDLVVNVVAAIAIFVIGRWVASVAVRLLNNVFERAKLDETLAKFLCRIAYTLILLFVAMAALDRLGVNTTSFAAIVAAAGLAIGLALQGSLANFAAGVMIILFRPFKAGDFIEAGGTTGVVEEIHIFHTMMRTGDNVQMIVPNNAITSGNISNYSAKPTRRIDLVVGCGYGDNLHNVKQFLNELVDRDPRVLAEPAPKVAVSELGDNSVNFVVRPWVANADYWKVRWDLIEAIKVGFDQHGFNIPFPQRDVHLHQVVLDDPQRKTPPASRAFQPGLGLPNQLEKTALDSVQASSAPAVATAEACERQDAADPIAAEHDTGSQDTGSHDTGSRDTGSREAGRVRPRRVG